MNSGMNTKISPDAIQFPQDCDKNNNHSQNNKIYHFYQIKIINNGNN